mmetsp:Transcript_62458/g.181075  ORF Transcript_62458/g.181075 Transcript_62458/m.181075 type:complete len:540 (-) Transcript_62458:103-1722(-)
MASDLVREAAVCLFLEGPCRLPIVSGRLAVERLGSARGHERRRRGAAHALLRAAPRSLGHGPARAPIRVTGFAVERLADNIGLRAAEPLLRVVPPAFPIVRSGGAIECDGPIRRDAADVLALATECQLGLAPTLGDANVALEGVASVALGHAAILFLPRRPALLPVPLPSFAVVFHGRCRASHVVLVAAPRFLRDGPIVDVRSVRFAVERIAPPPVLLATELFLALGPSGLPVREAGVAIVHLHARRRPAADTLVFTTPPFLLERPALLPIGEASLAIEVLALRASLAAAIGLLLLRPALPLLGAGDAIVLDPGTRRRAVDVLVLTAPHHFLGAPPRLVALLTVMRVASLALRYAALVLLLGRPAGLPIRPTGVAIEAQSSCLGAPCAILVAAVGLLRQPPSLWVPEFAVEGLATFARCLAAILLLPRAPSLLPIREAGIAIECERCGGFEAACRRMDAADRALVATPHVLGGGPLVASLQQVLRAVVRVASVALLQAAVLFLLFGPHRFPMLVIRSAVIVLIERCRQWHRIPSAVKWR